MTLLPEDTAFLRAAVAHGVTRAGSTWRAGPESLTRARIGRLIRAGYLRGKRGAATLDVTAQTRRMLATNRIPPIGSTIAFRDNSGWKRCKRYLLGRVLGTHHLDTVVASDGYIFLVSRPHGGAHWKGSSVSVGHFRGTPMWDVVVAAGLVPAIWFAPLEAPPFTLARLREVNARLAAIGGWRYFSAEERCAEVVSRLDQIRARAAGRFNRILDDEREYLERVLVNDATEIEAAEMAETRRAVEMAGRLGYHRLSDPVTIRTLDEIQRELTGHRPDLVARAYAELLPSWQRMKEVHDAYAARRSAR